MNDDEKPFVYWQVQEISSQIVHGNNSWFEKLGIEVYEKETCWIFSRKSDEVNHWNKLANGLAISKSGKIWSLPLCHISHLGEKNTPELRFHDCDLIEKIDGTQFIVSFPSKNCCQPLWHTQYEIYSKEKIPHKEMGKIDFNYSDTDFTYTFEYADPGLYPKERQGLYLVAGRNMETYIESDETSINISANRLKVSCPERWTIVKGWKNIKEIIAGYKEPYEGFILRDVYTGERVKLVKESYL